MSDPNRPAPGYPPAAHPNGYPAPNNPPPPGPGYVYAPPPPQPNPYYNHHPYYQQQYNDPDSLQRDACLRRVCGLIMALIIVSGTVVFILWLVLRPQPPEFRVNAFSISNLALPNYNNLIAFTSQVNITARNPNKKMSVKYDHIEAVIFYRYDSVASTRLPPFAQDTKSETPLTANFAVTGSFVGGPVASGINADMWGRGVSFNLRMLTTVRFEAKIWTTRRTILRVYCGDLNVWISGDGRSGSLSGGPRQCRVG